MGAAPFQARPLRAYTRQSPDHSSTHPRSRPRSGQASFLNAGTHQLLITPPAASGLGSVVSGDAHVCACVVRGEARDHVQCDAPRFGGIPSKWNIERQLIVAEEDAALTSIGSRECDESLHLARGPNFEFHARSIGPYLPAQSVVGQKRWTHIHLTVSPEEFFELLRRGARCLARRQCRPLSPD